jgi:predicted nucleic acid-binding Zn ribbon protein
MNRQLSVYDVINRYCIVCGAALEIKPTGRPRATCSDRCRQRQSRKARRRAAAETFRDGGAR